MNANQVTLTRHEFLADPEVAQFIQFFRPYLHSTEFAHRYFHYDSRRQWACTSLADAASKYSWPVDKVFRNTLGLAEGDPMPDDLHSNTAVLKDLQRRMREAYCAGDSKWLEKVCQEVFAWGGTLKGNPMRLAALNQEPGGLKAYLTICYIAFGAGEALNSNVFKKRSLVCNAGFTKIYSLQFGDFVIYDSRVAASLSLFVLLHCAANGKTAVPASLRFPCMSAKMQERKNGPPRQPLRRNPSARNAAGRTWDFPSCSNHHERHISGNLRANWVLGSAIADDPNPSQNQFIASYGSGALRALEAALFMVGYDLENAVLPQGVSWI